ncbi:MAG: hypothetical protein WBF54_15335 [Terriglobales bacterium]
MTKTALLKKIETAIDDAMSQRLYGTLEIEFKAGEPIYLKKLATEKLDEPGGRNDYTFRK